MSPSLLSCLLSSVLSRLSGLELAPGQGTHSAKASRRCPPAPSPALGVFQHRPYLETWSCPGTGWGRVHDDTLTLELCFPRRSMAGYPGGSRPPVSIDSTPPAPQHHPISR